MEKTKKILVPRKRNMITRLEQLARKARKSKLLFEFTEPEKPYVEEVNEFLGCTTMQSVLFAVIFKLSFKNSEVSIGQVSDFINCSPLRLLERIGDFEQLKKQRLIKIQAHSFRHQGFNYQEYFIPSRVTEAIGKWDKNLLTAEDKMDLIPLLDKVYSMVEERDDGQLTAIELSEEVNNMLKHNKQLNLVRQVHRLGLSDDELLLYLYTCRETVNGEEEVDLNHACNKIWEDISTRFSIKRNLVKGRSALIRLDLVKLQDGMFRSDREVLLTEKSLDLLLDGDTELLIKSDKKLPGLLPHDKIIRKALFFNTKERVKLRELSTNLSQRNFIRIQRRLAKKGMPTGMAILFHGSPGTGKTASVYDIAAKTSRDIMMVDISDTKSMWFGESEKKIKAVFTDYKKLLKKNSVAPILVFNEADAVFSKRQDVDRSGVGQTENAIQNIILQELEDFEGILIATTNLTNNFDQAFERRFLYKIEFHKPDVVSRTKIWKDKIPGLKPKQAGILAEKFIHTGGNIDNISRKIMMNSIVHGDKLEFDAILDYCRQESFSHQKKKSIGY